MHTDPTGEPYAHNAEQAEAHKLARAEADAKRERLTWDAVDQSASDLAKSLDEAEAELATERARLDAVVENGWLVHKGNEMFAVFSNECGDYITSQLETYRAAIDAAMKEDRA